MSFVNSLDVRPLIESEVRAALHVLPFMITPARHMFTQQSPTELLAAPHSRLSRPVDPWNRTRVLSIERCMAQPLTHPNRQMC